MWQKLSLRTRLSLLLALVLTLGLAVNITRLVLEAGPRVQAEDQSVIRLAREFIETLVVGLNDTPDADARLSRIVGDLNRLALKQNPSDDAFTSRRKRESFEVLVVFRRMTVARRSMESMLVFGRT